MAAKKGSKIAKPADVEPEVDEAVPLTTPPPQPRPKRTECPFASKEEFLSKAVSVPLVIGGQPRIAEVKEFSKGSFGWYLSDKVFVNIDGTETKVQINLSMTVIGSKELVEKSKK